MPSVSPSNKQTSTNHNIASDYFDPPTSPFWRNLHYKLVPLVHNYDHHVSSVQRFLGVMPPGELHNGRPYRYFPVHVFMCLASELGNEIYYAMWATFTGIYLDKTLFVPSIFLWAFTMYVGQFLKDSLRLPRPGLLPNTQVNRLETHYAAEFGFPSTHTMGSMSLPIYALMMLPYYTHADPFVKNMFIAANLFWCIVTPVSRLYLGVHSSLDIAGGGIIGFICFLLTYMFHSELTQLFLSTTGIILVLSLCIGLLYIYPRPQRWTNSPGDTAIVVATATGAIVGLALQGDVATPRILDIPTPVNTVIAVARFFLTLVLIYGTRTLIKPYVIRATRVFLQRAPKAPSVQDKQCGLNTAGESSPAQSSALTSLQKHTHDLPLHEVFTVELIDKGIGYMMMGLLATWVLPPIFQLIGFTFQPPQINY